MASSTPKGASQGNRKLGLAARTFGPVENLEDHLHHDWWRTIFDAYYLKTDGDVVEDPSITKKEVDWLESFLGLEPDMKLLDLCCGQGRHAIELATRGYKHVHGVDQSKYLVQQAKARSKKASMKIDFRVGDARYLSHGTGSMDVVTLMGNSFGYFEKMEDDLRVLHEIKRVLKPGGRVFMDLAEGEFLEKNFQPRSWEWIDKDLFVTRERTLTKDKRLISREIITHVKKGVLGDRFYAERLYTKESIKQLLISGGFSNVVFHGTCLANSSRNQDLGMMERRHLVSATSESHFGEDTSLCAQPFGRVVVLMGDPDRPDVVKPDATFDEDDFHTIEELKRAMESLDGYSVSYFHDHDTLLEDLLMLRQQEDRTLILNLCDEGYFNDPRKELHVTALLEVLGLPYTGSGPQALSSCYDKSLVRGIAREIGVPVCPGFLITGDDFSVPPGFDFPALLKPNFGDSSFGITVNNVVRCEEDIHIELVRVRKTIGTGEPVLVEQFMEGPEVTIGLIGNGDDILVLPLAEEDYSCLPEGMPRLCGYEAKWDPASPYWNLSSKPACIPDATKDFIIQCSKAMFERLQCRDYARLDWRLDDRGNPHLLEVNPNPGWCWDGHLAKMARLAGHDYANMLELILKAATFRYLDD